MLASTASAPRVMRCSLGLYWSRDLCTAGWLRDVILSRSDSERQRNLMIHGQRPLPVYFSQISLAFDKEFTCIILDDIGSRYNIFWSIYSGSFLVVLTKVHIKE